MRSLVSGGAGFIGSHLVDALVARGDQVRVIDDLSSGRMENLGPAIAQGASISRGDIVDADFVAAQVGEFAPDVVFHLAAQADVRRAVADPVFDAQVNVIGTINLLEAARACGAALVFASTGGAIYGEGSHRHLPVSESADAAPETAYGVSKLTGESYLAYYRRLHGLRGVALRFGNVYGPRQDPHGEAGVVAIFSGLLRAQAPLRVFGDGRQTRDYVYVGDVVRALVVAQVSLLERGAAVEGPYNIGTGIEVDVIELVRRLGEIAGTQPEIDHRPERLGEVRRIAIDPQAAGRDLGWRAETALVDGLRGTYESLAVG